MMAMLKRVFSRLGGWVDGHFISATLGGLVVLFLFVFFFGNIFVTVPSGHRGVLWHRFFGGTVIGSSYGEGTKVIFPWDRIYVYDMRLHQSTEKFDVLTKEGLQIAVSATLRFRLNPKAIGTIHAQAGPNYVDVLVIPSIGAAVRMEAAKHTLEEIYSSNRNQIERDVQARATKTIDDLIQAGGDAEPEIFVEDFWFRSISLPKGLEHVIEDKLAERERAEQYAYILQREQQEKARKEIEAQGIKAFQDIVSSGITESYLRWKGIDATVKLAESHNAKIVVFGGKDGLPLILNPSENSVPLTTPPAPHVTGAATATPVGPPSVATPERR